MSEVVARYQEILALTQSYLLGMGDPKRLLLVDQEAYHYFRAQVKPIENRERRTPAPAPPLPIPVKLKQPAPPTPAPPPIAKETPPPPKEMVKETLPVTPIDLSDWHKVLHNIAPSFKIVDKIPEATQTAPAMVLIAPRPTSSEAQAFLRHVQRAIELQHGPCRVHFSDQPPPKEDETRVVTLQDLNRYLADPQQKAALWNQLCAR